MARPRKDDPKRQRMLADVIGRGAQLIRSRGHCIGALNDDSGRLCLMGAIREAARDESRDIRFGAYDEVNKRLRRAGHAIHSWSDEQTDGGRVADLLEGVARELDPGFRPLQLCWHGTPLGIRCAVCSQEPRVLDDAKPLCPHMSFGGSMCAECRDAQAVAYLAVRDDAKPVACDYRCYRQHRAACPLSKAKAAQEANDG